MQVVDQLEALGYSREDCLRALRNEHWDPEAALDFLENDGEEEFDDQPDLHEDAIDMFLNDPRFQPIREAIRQNPSEISVYLERLRQEHPQMHADLTSDPMMVHEILQELMAGSLDHEGYHGEDEDDEWEDDGLNAHHQQDIIQRSIN